jgi:transketolase
MFSFGLHLTGYDLSLDDLKRFRQWGSKTPGHPERGLTPGVEVTTGPLGQGFAAGVGMAIAAHHLAARFNRPGHQLINARIFAIVTEGDLMEGLTSEAASLAGHLRLGRLVYLYDDNRISIDGSVELSFTEDRAARFSAYGWHIQKVDDGNAIDAINAAIEVAVEDPRPSLILCRTVIGFGAPTRQGTARAHGEPLGEEELAAAKQNLGWPANPSFHIPPDVLEFYRTALVSGARMEADWIRRLEAYRVEFRAEAAELERRIAGQLPPGWRTELPVFAVDQKGLATRAASGRSLDVLAKAIPELVGGSADLTPSNNTRFAGAVDFQKESPEGRYLRFGVREHAMSAVLNGLAAYGGFRPFGGTFLTFSDYMRPAIRIAAISHLGAIYVFTHDSIGLGEDGPTHQPTDALAGWRHPQSRRHPPADANGAVQAWRWRSRDEPAQRRLANAPALPTLEGTSELRGFARGAVCPGPTSAHRR